MFTLHAIISTVIELLMAVALLILIVRIRHLRVLYDELSQEKEVMFGFIHDIAEVFADADTVDMDLMLRRVLFYAMRTTRAGAGAVYVLDHDGVLRARALSGLFPPMSPEAPDTTAQAASKAHYVEQLARAERIHVGQGLVGTVADLGRPILIEDAERDPRVPRYKDEYLRIHSVLMVPMRFHDRILGVLAVVNRVDGRPFIQTDLNLLEALADQASVSIHFAQLREALEEKRRIDHDLDLARHIQGALLPKYIPTLEGIQLAAFNDPALEVGGDYYDFVPVDDDHVGLVIADVSGKGISGAIMMSVCRSVLRSQARGCQHPTEVLRAVNRFMYEDIAEDMFVSMLYMVYDIRSHRLLIARAGHERPLLYSPADDRFTILDSGGIALGIGPADNFDRLLEEASRPVDQ